MQWAWPGLLSTAMLCTWRPASWVCCALCLACNLSMLCGVLDAWLPEHAVQYVSCLSMLCCAPGLLSMLCCVLGA